MERERLELKELICSSGMIKREECAVYWMLVVGFEEKDDEEKRK